MGNSEKQKLSGIRKAEMERRTAMNREMTVKGFHGTVRPADNQGGQELQSRTDGIPQREPKLGSCTLNIQGGGPELSLVVSWRGVVDIWCGLKKQEVSVRKKDSES